MDGQNVICRQDTTRLCACSVGFEAAAGACNRVPGCPLNIPTLYFLLMGMLLGIDHALAPPTWRQARLGGPYPVPMPAAACPQQLRQACQRATAHLQDIGRLWVATARLEMLPDGRGTFCLWMQTRSSQMMPFLMRHWLHIRAHNISICALCTSDPFWSLLA